MSTSTKRLSWGTRLAVTIIGLNEGEELFPIQSFNYTFDTPNQVLDTADDGNVGYQHSPRRYRFNLSVYPLAETGGGRNALKVLNSLALAGREFDMTITKAEKQDFSNPEDEWSYKTISIGGCMLDGGGIGQYNNDGRVPSVSINGKALTLLLDGEGQDGVEPWS